MIAQYGRRQTHFKPLARVTTLGLAFSQNGPPDSANWLCCSDGTLCHTGYYVLDMDKQGGRGKHMDVKMQHSATLYDLDAGHALEAQRA